MYPKLWEIGSGLFFQDPDPQSRSWFFLPIPDPGVIRIRNTDIHNKVSVSEI
jgi:hypothetical protein